MTANRTQGKRSQTVTIAGGATASSAAYLEDFVLCGFITPAAFTGTSVTFQGSLDNSTFTTIYDYTNTVIGVSTVVTSRAYSLNVIDFLGWPYIKIVSNGAEGAARDVILLSTRALNSR